VSSIYPTLPYYFWSNFDDFARKFIYLISKISFCSNNISNSWWRAPRLRKCTKNYPEGHRFSLFLYTLKFFLNDKKKIQKGFYYIEEVKLNYGCFSVIQAQKSENSFNLIIQKKKKNYNTCGQYLIFWPKVSKNSFFKNHKFFCTEGE
jgi:hypothetical protein